MFVLETLLFICFFFFQAEDGIRDFHVTGVQTCALPIYRPWKGCRGRISVTAVTTARPQRPAAHRRRGDQRRAAPRWLPALRCGRPAPTARTPDPAEPRRRCSRPPAASAPRRSSTAVGPTPGPRPPTPSPRRPEPRRRQFPGHTPRPCRGNPRDKATSRGRSAAQRPPPR